jgi:hypothetical protein
MPGSSPDGGGGTARAVGWTTQAPARPRVHSDATESASVALTVPTAGARPSVVLTVEVVSRPVRAIATVTVRTGLVQTRRVSTSARSPTLSTRKESSTCTRAARQPAYQPRVVR